MIVSRRFPKRMIIPFALRNAGIGAIWATAVYFIYTFVPPLHIIQIPFLPIATIGTAVAFYIGFKNNSAYERFWEGRKIWGGIVNESRTWTNYVLNYVLPTKTGKEAEALRRTFVYRHIAWINALRLQLRKTSRFFNKPAPTTKRRLEKHAEHMRNDWDKEIAPFLSEDELEKSKGVANPATHLLQWQGQDLAKLHSEGSIDLFHQIAMMDVVRELYSLQGKCERIKNTPFPRQYAEFSRMFTRVFIFLVPFGLLDVFARHIESGSTLDTILPVLPMLVSAALITWVFSTMEGIGDSSEDPFERSMNDVPMNALCRAIEIDLRQMLGETEVPEKEKVIDNLLY